MTLAAKNLAANCSFRLPESPRNHFFPFPRKSARIIRATDFAIIRRSVVRSWLHNTARCISTAIQFRIVYKAALPRRCSTSRSIANRINIGFQGQLSELRCCMLPLDDAGKGPSKYNAPARARVYRETTWIISILVRVCRRRTVPASISVEGERAEASIHRR